MTQSDIQPANHPAPAACADAPVRVMRPRGQYLDTALGEACHEGAAFALVWLEGRTDGFYLGCDTDSWARGLYFMPVEEHEGFYCLYGPKISAGEPELKDFAEALAAWQESGLAGDLTALLAQWDARREAILAALLTESVDGLTEFHVSVCEQQSSKRYGVRRVKALSLDSARHIARTEPDDDLTEWGAWEPDGHSRLSAPTR